MNGRKKLFAVCCKQLLFCIGKEVFRMSIRRVEYDKDAYERAKRRRKAFSEKQKLDRIPLDYKLEKGPWKYDMAQRCNDPRAAVEQFVLEAEHTLNGFPQGDHLPVFNLAYLGEGVIPSMFGAIQVPDRINPPFTQGRILSDLERDLPKLKRKIDPEKDGWGSKVKEAIECFLEIAEGEFQVTNVDIQSPYGVATKLISNEDLMIAMYDTPELVKELFEICTQAIIDTTYAVIRWAGGEENVALNANEPYGKYGISMYDDYVSVISPALSDELCLPFNQKIFEIFGKGHYHTCGPYFPNYVEAMLHNNPRILDINAMRSPLQKTREDMQMLKSITQEHGILLAGDITAYPISQFDFASYIYPDREFIKSMCGDGRTLYRTHGTAERGKELFRLCDECLAVSE